MLTVLYSAKGGQGTTTIAAALAVIHREIILLDGAGDLPAALGMPEPDGPGLSALMAGPAPLTADQLAQAAASYSDHPPMLPTGGRLDQEPERWVDLAGELHNDRRHWLIDVGTGPGIAAAQFADQVLLVTRNCYLALRRLMDHPVTPTGVILVREPGHPLTAADVETVARARVVATIHVDPAVARACDAGLLAGRLPHSLRRPLAGAVDNGDAR